MKNDKLVIVESPSKAKTIQHYLGAGYRVMASGGHICDLPERSLGIDVENRFKPEYVIADSRKGELVKKLKQAVAESSITYLATDPDREGEAISWHLANALDITGRVNRVEFNEISPKVVAGALESPREINMNLVNAQQARRILDRLVGYKISPVLSRKIKSNLSGGRVQSAALKMIVDREREIRAFVPQEYWNVYAYLFKESARSSLIRALLADKNGRKIKPENEQSVNEILAALNGAAWRVDTVKKGTSKSRPSPPFTTSTMQQDASQKLGLSSPMIAQIAQQLYEGVEIEGEGHVAFVTYIRTDSVRISPEMQFATLAFIKDKFGKDYAPARPNIYSSKGGNVQDAHEAIRPISLARNPEDYKTKLSRNQYNLYKLIYYRYLASQMSDAVYTTMTARVEAETISGERYGFKVNGKSVLFKGYTAVYQNEKEGDDEDNSDKLPELNDGEALTCKEIKPEQKFTKPLPRYTEATLIKAMDENGIGRPSTYPTIISVLTKREYMTREQKALKPTALGEAVTDFMEKYFEKIVDIGFTAAMETQLDAVEKGAEWQKILEAFYPGFLDDIKKAYTDEKKMTLAEEVSTVPCDKCGAMMVVREGKYGKFLACPNYPRCKNIKSLAEPVGTCPMCGGDITKRRSKAGKIFYGCGNYPQCKFMSWEIPAPVLCAKCGSVMRIKNDGDKKQYVCTKRGCGYTLTPTEEERNVKD